MKLGNPNGARTLRGKQVGNKEAVAAIKFRAQEHANNLRSIVDDVRAQGITSIRKIAEELNQRGVVGAKLHSKAFGQNRHLSLGCRVEGIARQRAAMLKD